ncbi:hypothetical protein AB3U99_13865 [Niallia sp. JL1B1071]
MKKKIVIFSVAAASTLMMAIPLASKTEAASIQPNEAKVIYQSYNLSEDHLNKMINNFSTNYQFDMDKVWNELRGSVGKQQTYQYENKQKEVKKHKPEHKDKKNKQNQSKPETTTSQNNKVAEPTKNNTEDATASVSAYE